MPNGTMSLNLHWYDQPTVSDRLNDKGKDWKVYFGDTPLSFLLVHQWEPENVARHHSRKPVTLQAYCRSVRGRPLGPFCEIFGPAKLVRSSVQKV